MHHSTKWALSEFALGIIMIQLLQNLWIFSFYHDIFGDNSYAFIYSFLVFVTSCLYFHHLNFSVPMEYCLFILQRWDPVSPQQRHGSSIVEVYRIVEEVCLLTYILIGILDLFHVSFLWFILPSFHKKRPIYLFFLVKKRGFNFI